MSIFRHPFLWVLLALGSCYWAYHFGKGEASQQVMESVEEKRSRGGRESRELRSDRERTRSLRREIEHCVSAEDFRRVLDDLQFQADKTEENRLLSVFFKQWLEVSPKDALAEVRRVENLRHDLIRTAAVFETWAKDRPADALGLLKEVLDGRQNEASSRPPFLDGIDPPEYLLSIVAGLAKVEPKALGDLLQAAEVSPVMGNAMDVLFQSWYPKNAEEVFGWAKSLEEGDFREGVLSRVAAKAGQFGHPGEGIAWAQSLTNSGEQELALKSLTEQWAQRRSREAFQWVTGQADEVKFALLPAVMKSFAKVEPGAAADWLNQFEASPQMDASVAAYALAIAAVNPTAALGTAEVITDEAERERVAGKIARDWEARDPEAFKAFREGMQ